MTYLRVALLSFALSCGVATSYADAVRNGSVQTLSLQRPTPYPILRGDNQRTGRSPGFPASLEPLWRFNAKSGINLPAVAASGFVEVATTSGHLLRLDIATGKERQRVVLPAAPLQGPLITSRGDRLVITAGGECVGYTSSGELRFRSALPARPESLRVAPIVPKSGGIVLAADKDLLHLDGEGRLMDRIGLSEAPLGALLESEQGVIAVGQFGHVFRWRSPDPPVLLGSLGGAPSSLAALTGRSLVTAVGGDRLVFFDLEVGVPGVSVSSPFFFVGAVSIAPGGEVWTMTSAGGLRTMSPHGEDLHRASVLGGAGDLEATGSAMLVTEGGKVAFFRPSGELTVWSSEGEIRSDQRACSGPIGLLSDGLRLIVTCRDGTIAAFGTQP